MKILYAKSINDYETALIIEQWGGNYLGGVAVLHSIEQEMGFSRPTPWNLNGCSFTMTFRIQWIWWIFTDNPEDFVNHKRWEEGPPKQIENKKLLTQGESK